MLSVGLGHVSQQDASWGLPRPAARRPGVKAICKAVHAPAKPASHLPLWVLHYMAHGCPCGCDAAQDRLTSKHCRAFQCPGLVSHTDHSRSIFPWVFSCCSSTNTFHKALCDISHWLGDCLHVSLPGVLATREGRTGPAGLCRVCSGSSNNETQARSRRAVSVVASEGSLGKSRTS